jgi:hypothetical protein
MPQRRFGKADRLPSRIDRQQGKGVIPASAQHRQYLVPMLVDQAVRPQRMPHQRPSFDMGGLGPNDAHNCAHRPE